MQTDFIKVPYTTGPSMIKNDGPVFIANPNIEVIKQKHIQLEKFGKDLHGQTVGLSSVVKKASKYCGMYADNILELGLMLEEDVAIIHQGNLAAICFCFPSGFIPQERVGLSLEEVHRPVADGDLLRRASPGIARVMSEQPSFKRWVWTITNNPNLSNHPTEKIDQLPQTIDDLYFRYETQTTAKVDSDTSLFFVKVDVVPLRDVYNQTILESINSMSDAVLEYKNLTYIKNLLNSL